MSMLEFPKKYIEWMYNGVTSAPFSLNINGALVDYFHNERGLDKVTLYHLLFLIAMKCSLCSLNGKWSREGLISIPVVKS